MNLLQTGSIADTLIDAKQSKGLIESLATKDDLPFSNITNCHGTTFASGQVWIENDQVGALMKGDRYRELNKSENPQEGDVGIYGNAQHSVRVETKWRNSYLVNTKGGITSQRIDTAARAWTKPSDKLKYFTQRPKPKK